MEDTISTKPEQHDLHIENLEKELKNVSPTASIDPNIEPELHWRTWLVLFAGCFCWGGINWGVSATGFWLSYTVADIGGADVALWFGEGFLVTQVALTPIWGTISDFSPAARKYSVITLLSIASVGTFIAASAKEMDPTAIAGIGLYGCGLIAYGPIAAIVSDVFPRRMRGFTAGCLYASVALGGLLCDIVGGAVIQNGGPSIWRFNVYMSGGLMLAGAALIFLCYKPLPRIAGPDDLSFAQQMVQFDWIGSIIFIFFAVFIMLALIQGGNAYPWSSPRPIAFLSVAGTAIVLLFIHQYRFKKNGIFHRGLFKNRNWAIAVLASFIEGIVYITLNIFLGSQVGTLFDNRPIFKGLHFAVILITSSITSLLAGLYSQRFREIRIPLVAGFVGFAACAAAFSRLTPKTSKAVPYVICAFIGVAFGPPQGLLITAGQLAVDPMLVGSATSLIIGLRSLGGAIGAAIATAIFTPKIQEFLPARIAEYLANAGVPQDVLVETVTAILTAVPGTYPTVPAGVTADQVAAGHDGYLKAFADAYAYVYYSIIPWAILAAITLCFLRSVRETMSWQIDRAVERPDQLKVSHHVDDDATHNRLEYKTAEQEETLS